MAQFKRPDSNVTQTNFTNGFAQIDEVTPSDADYAYSANNTIGTLEVGLSNISDPQSGTCTVRYRHAQSDDDAGTIAPSSGGNNVTITCSVYQGTSLIVADTGQTANAGSFVQRSFTFSTSLVTNWSDLRLRFTTTASGGSPAARRGAAVSWAEVETPDAAVNVTASVTGLSATGSVGDTTETGSAVVDEIGVSATGQVGTVYGGTFAGLYFPLPIQIGASAGAVNVLVTGVSGTGVIGTVTVTGTALVTEDGVFATGQVGTVAVNATAVAGVTAVATTGETGDEIVTGTANVFPTGVPPVGVPILNGSPL